MGGVMRRINLVGIFAAALLTSGTATAAELAANNAALLFGDVPLGQSALANAIITNLGSGVVESIVFSVSGNSQEFVVHKCASSLLPGRSCTVIVELVPLHYGAKRRTLTVDGAELQSDGSYTDVSVSIDLVGTSNN